jgi:TAZ zinc finger
MAGYSSEMSNQVSTSYRHASPTVTSSHPIQQAHNFRASQSVEQQCARAVPLNKNQQLLVMYDHAMVCKEACGLPFCEKLKKLLGHAVQCNSVQCTRSCMLTQKVIKHFKACYDPGCAQCGPVKKLVSRRNAQIDNEHSMRHDLSADEPEPKRFKTDQPNGMLVGVNTGLEKEVDAKVVSGEQSVKELRAESYKDLGCAVNEVTKEPQIKSVKKFYSLVDNSVTIKPSVKSAMDEILTKEVQVETDKLTVQSSSLVTPASEAAASTSTPNNFREFRTEAANSQLKGTFLLEQIAIPIQSFKLSSIF